MNRALNPRNCVARLNVPRAEGGRGLISLEECIGQAKNSLQNYILHSDEKLIQAARKGEVVTHDFQTPKDFKQRRKAERKREWKEKVLYGQFLRQKVLYGQVVNEMRRPGHGCKEGTLNEKQKP